MGRDLFIFAMLSPAELNVRQKTQLLLHNQKPIDIKHTFFVFVYFLFPW
jgi:hypothetical protein